MIWHILEVWVVLAVLFAVGAVLGAYLYVVLAESRYATVQGAVADRVGDVFDRIKARTGLAPSWRRSQLSGVARPQPVRPPQPPPTLQLPPPEPKPAPRPARSLPPPEAKVLPRPSPASAGSGPKPPPLASRAPVVEEEVEVEPRRRRVQAADPDRVASAIAVGSDGIVPKRPAGLGAPRAGVPDNLTRIRGVGRRNEQLLNSLGIYHFGQIAAWTPAEMRWIGQYLAFPGAHRARRLDRSGDRARERRRHRFREGGGSPPPPPPGKAAGGAAGPARRSRRCSARRAEPEPVSPRAAAGA